MEGRPEAGGGRVCADAPTARASERPRSICPNGTPNVDTGPQFYSLSEGTEYTNKCTEYGQINKAHSLS